MTGGWRVLKVVQKFSRNGATVTNCDQLILQHLKRTSHDSFTVFNARARHSFYLSTDFLFLVPIKRSNALRKTNKGLFCIIL